jgi:hypothetical protein
MRYDKVGSWLERERTVLEALACEYPPEIKFLPDSLPFQKFHSAELASGLPKIEALFNS